MTQAYSENKAAAKAALLRESGQAAAALSLLHVACDEQPGDPAIWHQLGISYARAGKTEYAHKCLLRAAELDPCNIQIASHLANILVLRKDIAAALEQAEKLVVLAPDDTGFRLFLGNIYASCGRLDDALRCVLDVIARAPALAAAHALQTQIQFGRRAFAEARAAALKTLQLEPGNAVAQRVLQQIGLVPAL